MKYINPLIQNVALDYIRNNTDVMHICDSAPTGYEELLLCSLGSTTMSISNFSITKTGITSGRRVSVLDTELTADSSGNVLYAAIADSSESELFYVAEINTVSIIASSIYEIKEWDIEFRDPV